MAAATQTRQGHRMVVDENALEEMLVDCGADGADMGRRLYAEIYLNRGYFGLHRTHDGDLLLYHKQQFEHAFYTTSDRWGHPDRKDVLRVVSVQRIRWIDALVRGQVVGSACFHVPSPTGRIRPPNRLYAIYATPFVVWLEPRRESGLEVRIGISTVDRGDP